MRWRLSTSATALLCLALAFGARRAPTGTLVLTGNMGKPRSSHTSTLLPDGRVLITGGMERNGVFFASAEVFDPGRGSFMPAADMAAKRVSHTATRLRNGKILIAGGLAESWVALPTAEIYDPVTGAFHPTGSMGTPRSAHTATLLRDGRVLLAGGTGTGRPAPQLARA